MKPKYLDKVQACVKEGILGLNGNRILLEMLEEEEPTTKSGIITSVGKEKSIHAADRARVAVVLAAGPGYDVEETQESVPLEYKAGDYVLVNQFAVKTFGAFFGLSEYRPDSIGLATDDLIQARIANFEAFNSILKG